MDNIFPRREALSDKRTECLSIMDTMTVESYLQFIGSTYENRGGIEKQRAPLNTKTAIRIRQIMVDDIITGAILPPIVVGAVVSDDIFTRITSSNDEIATIFATLPQENISIIDGIQRTTALIEALQRDEKVRDHPVRVEYWVAKSINSLIYRMLVLNTGQVPWDLRRQLETIYKTLIKEIRDRIPSIEILAIEDNSRRRRPGVFQADKIIELFLAFTSRKISIDLKEKVANDFARMDAIESLASEKYLNCFMDVLEYLVSLDNCFSRFTNSRSDDQSQKEKFIDGIDIFKSQPAAVGFIVASAIYIFGRPGMKHGEDEIDSKLLSYNSSLTSLSNRLNTMLPSELTDFLDFTGLNERIAIKSGKVGDFEREFFSKAFGMLIEIGPEITSMGPCWEAYY